MIFYLVALSVFVFDQIIKYLVKSYMVPAQSIPVIKNILHLTYVQNKGAAFGLFYGKWLFLIVIGVIVITAILFFHYKLSSHNYYQIPLAFILGGSLGNFYDRVFHMYVVDYIDFRIWPVFNLADIMINVGVFLLIVKILFIKEKSNVSRTV